MPDMNGVELIRKLRAHVPGLRVVVMSGIADTLGLSEANTGADAVIQKSANEVPQLVRCVNRLLGRDAPRKPPRSYRQARQPGRKSIY
jgi:DNA-binding NarL/FixJ family response regulator